MRGRRNGRRAGEWADAREGGGVACVVLIPNAISPARAAPSPRAPHAQPQTPRRLIFFSFFFYFLGVLFPLFSSDLDEAATWDVASLPDDLGAVGRGVGGAGHRAAGAGAGRLWVLGMRAAELAHEALRMAAGGAGASGHRYGALKRGGKPSKSHARSRTRRI